MKAWTQEELALARALGDWETLWMATVPLVKMQYGRMVRSGTVPEPEYKGDDHWLSEMMLLAGEAMRTWDPAKVAYSTHVLNRASHGILTALEVDARGGVTARRGTPVQVVSLEDQRPGADGGYEEDDAADQTYGAAVAYGGVVERGKALDPDEVPEGLGDPADEAARMQTQERLVAALVCLPPEEREALLAVQTEAVGAYARRVGVDPATVWRRVGRARTKVQDFLEPGGN